MTDLVLLTLLVCLAVVAGAMWVRILAAVIADAEERKAVTKWWEERRRYQESPSLEDDSPRDAANSDASR